MSYESGGAEMSTGYAHKRGGGARGNQWGQAYGSHGGEAGKGEMRLGIDFPYVCERCLGPNPYVQMIKSNFGAACRISKRPFHVFKWTNPKSRRRIKTVISYEAASVRNCCQACMSDMTYGVPLVVRDALLMAAGMGAHEDLPESEVGQSFFFNQRDREAELIAGGAVGMTAQQDPRLKLDNAAQVLQANGGHPGGTLGNGRWGNTNSNNTAGEILTLREILYGLQQDRGSLSLTNRLYGVHLRVLVPSKACAACRIRVLHFSSLKSRSLRLQGWLRGSRT